MAELSPHALLGLGDLPLLNPPCSKRLSRRFPRIIRIDFFPGEKVIQTQRREERIPGVLPVKIFLKGPKGESVNGLAHTLNLSMRGARLGGVSVAVKPGTLIRIERGRASGNFRVVWAQERHLGVESLQPAGSLWGLEKFAFRVPTVLD